MAGANNEPRRWTCAVCDRRVFRVEVAAATVPLGTGWQVRFDVLGACREHQPQIRQRLTTKWSASLATVSAHLRPNTLATWAANARRELLSAVAAGDAYGTEPVARQHARS